MLNVKRAFLFLLVSLLAVGAMANNFRAGDLVYLPAAGRVQGAAFFKTDVWISNLDATNRVVIDVAYAPTGNADNRNVTASLIRLTTLNPGERREFVDIFGPGGLNLTGTPFGQLLFFACREGGNCANCDTNPADCKLITVEARVYAELTTGCAGGATLCTNGQDIPAIPWYNYASVDSQAQGLHRVFITGLRQTGLPGAQATFRSNLGFANASQFSSTTLRVTLFNSAGVSQGSKDIVLNPLAHRQLALNHPDLFPNFTGSGAFVTIEQVNFTIVPGAAEALPGFFAYGSVLDNIGSDPTTLEAQYFMPLDPVCIYGTGKTVKRPARR